MPLDLENSSDWPLASKDTVALYNRLDAVLADIRATLPRLWEAVGRSPEGRPDDRPLTGRAADVAGTLQLRRCRVGFLGGSGVGKSTTLISVLGMPREETPAKEGTGDQPTTSAVTRLIGVPGQRRDAKPGCKLIYLTRAQFQARRNDLCALTGLVRLPVDASKEFAALRAENDTILGKLAELAAAAGATESVTARRHRTQFTRFLNAFRQHGEQLVQATAFVDPNGDYNRRADYINHPTDTAKPDDQAPRYLLLREVEIGLSDEILPATLELIDLPGLGSENAADDSLTLAYLPTLHGGLIFRGVDPVTAAQAYALLDVFLAQYRQDLKDRAWMLVTRIDNLSEVALHGEAGDATKTFFDSLLTSLGNRRLPLDQLLFVSNTHAQETAKQQKVGGAFTAADWGKRLGLPVAADGTPQLPPVFGPDRLPVFAPAYREVLADGGIDKVRRTIRQTLADAVRRRVQADAKRDIREVATELVARVAADRDRADMNIEQIVAAAKWQAAIGRFADRILSERLIEPHTRALGRVLRSLFNQLCEAGQRIAPKELAEKHDKSIAPLLRRQLEAHCRSELLPGVLDTTARELEVMTRAAQVPDFTLRDGTTPADSVRAIGKSVAALAGEWLAPVFGSFADVKLFRTTASGEVLPKLGADEYRRVMHGKIDAVACECGHRVATRLRDQLAVLRRRLALLGELTEGDVSVGKEQFDDLIRALEGIITDAA